MLSKLARRHCPEAHKAKVFDPADEEHVQELKDWCKVHWENTICKGVESYNAPTYHDCCISFSKRNFTGKRTHLPLQAASVLKIPSLRKAKSPEDLYNWIRERMLVHQRLGRKPVFPSINTHHVELDQEETEAEMSQCSELLQRVYKDLFDLQKRSEERIKQLSEDNQRLLAASKSWCLKYQDLLTSKEDDRMSFAEMTPQKALKIDDTNSSFLMF